MPHYLKIKRCGDLCTVSFREVGEMERILFLVVDYSWLEKLKMIGNGEFNLVAIILIHRLDR